ncbi:nucleoside 2-deoxyribosyltransferase [Loigolactobacillus backii]|uniref:nucleoside 2-deoxyribosyltransferase n=1 Tax=Loigolactobacillus backii TaxID=375175 RepID=UPI000C1CAFBD|nr:nucleoside 2-deoxyribosyltransferase [Loigolactobacillus backii]PIO82453.1 nucleoside 2-deoxyribosyltransferase [Loigolactobacillus backii]
MTQIYLAGPFFSTEQIKRLKKVAVKLQQNPTVENYFSPMMDTNHAGLEEGTKKWQALVYQEDMAGLTTADVVVAIYDYIPGYTDPGTMFEIGYATAKKIPVVLYHEGPEPLNLMISQGLTTYVTEVKQLATLDFTNLPKIAYQGDVF